MRGEERAVDFDAELDKFWRQVGEARLMVLATSARERPTARMMSVVAYDGKLAFQTSRLLTKFEQLTKNPRVALCFDNVQIEGAARPCGHPLDAANASFADRFRAHHPASYKAYSHMRDNRVVEVTPTHITLWCYEGREPCRVFLDVARRRAAFAWYEHGE